MASDAETITKELIDRGKIVEAGWVSLKLLVLNPDANENQLKDMRMAFFAGAQHLFGTLMSALDPGKEATEKDMERMSSINDELQRFISEMQVGAKADAEADAETSKREQLGDAPIELEYRQKMEAMAATLDEFLNTSGEPRQTGFVLLVFPFGEREGRCNFISNGANRDDIVKLFEEMIERFNEDKKENKKETLQ